MLIGAPEPYGLGGHAAGGEPEGVGRLGLLPGEVELDVPAPAPGGVGSVNSLSSTPILRSTHSIGSKPPVRMPMRGMSPSLWFFGIVSVPAGTLLAPHEVRDVHRELPAPAPELDDERDGRAHGHVLSVKVPSGAVYVVTSGLPAAVEPQTSQVMPAAKGCSPGSVGSFGM